MKKKTMKLSPFANESDSLSIGGLTIENRLDRVSIYGSIDITKDLEGQGNAGQLKLLLDAIVAALHEGDLPENISVKSTKEIQNPFA